MGKEEDILKNNNGFTLVETVVAASLLFTTIIIIIPISSLITIERAVLEERYSYTTQLNIELQPFIHSKHKSLPSIFEQRINNKIISFQINKDQDNLIKGCAFWDNARNENERMCLYGYQKK